ncbi:MAG TPA: carboxylesterase family protein [Novosphingobium sp.]|nr:carboxylesterase family protein [Novosphingobium sp.]
MTANFPIDRRSLLAASVVGGAASALPAGAAGTSAAGLAAAAGTLTTPTSTIVDTTAGRVRGFVRNGITIYRGLPYAGKVSGEGRFLPAVPAKGWTGIRSTLSYGPVCPQPERDWSNDEMAFYADWNDGHPGEDCLTLNIWTGSTQKTFRRPVMVWLHGGGFVAGSSHEQPSYDGARLAGRGVVVVSVNHRLGAFGFMDLSAVGGSDYAASGNLGMTDIVLALRWVRDNIAQFGGDPDRVTIFGQSGGGGKVASLMAMPAAKGLFHRAIVMSGSFRPMQSQDQAREFTEAMMRELGTGDIAALRRVEARRLVAAGEAVQRRLSGRSLPPGFGKGRISLGRMWSPVDDGITFEPGAWANAAPAVSRDVPLMVGTVRDEFRLSTIVANEAALRGRLDAAYKADGPAMLEALHADFPGMSSNDLNGVLSGVGWRLSALDQLNLKAAQGGAPAYGYWFTYSPPLLDGRMGVPHCADIAYAFDNTRLADQLTGNSPEAQAVADALSGAFLSFAKDGAPIVKGQTWRPHDASTPTMVFERTASLVHSPAPRTFALAQKLA